MRTLNKALFLDLDGTLIVTKSGSTFAKSKDDWQYKPGIISRIDSWVDKGYYLMIVSNQGGIEAGHVTMNDFRQKMRQVINGVLEETGCPFSSFGYRYCISNNAEDFFRKPNPGMGYDLALSYILDLSQSVMVGDASGKVRRREVVYKNADFKWVYEDGQLVSDVDYNKITTGEYPVSGDIVFRDHADSDLKFAQSCGMQYIDVEDFLKQEKNG